MKMAEGSICNVGGLKYELFQGHYIDDFMISGCFHEKWTESWLRGNLNKESVAIDVGANFGCFSVLMAHLSKYLYCFEPMPVFDRIITNMELNGLENYEAFNCAVGDMAINEVTANFQTMWDGLVHEEKVRVPMLALDEVINEKVSLVKIDTDGKELPVIKGMVNILNECRPVVCQELAVKTFDFDGTTWSDKRVDNVCNWEEILDIYFSLGYEIAGQSLGSGAKTAEDIINIYNQRTTLSSIDVLLKAK
jgi:FkbM family methyltransferase